MHNESNSITLAWSYVIYILFNHRYLTRSGERCNIFLRIVYLFDGKAETIEKALLQFCDVAGIEMRKVMGFGSDGAAVMVGRVSGVSTRLKVHNPVMINIHCVAHRLALAAAQASGSIRTYRNSKMPSTISTSFITTALSV